MQTFREVSGYVSMGSVNAHGAKGLTAGGENPNISVPIIPGILPFVCRKMFLAFFPL